MAKKVGRPSKYTPQLVEEICERLSKGEPLAQICRDEDMPVHATLWNWMHDKEDLERAAFVSEAIARAREDGEEQIALDCINIADDNGRDLRILESGVEITNSDVVQRAKLRIDTRLKLLAKWNPKKWADNLKLSGDKDNPLEMVVDLTKAL